MAPVIIDPDFAAATAAKGPQPPLPTITNAHEYRSVANALIGSLLDFPVPPSVVETNHLITSFDGAQIAVYHFARHDKVNLTTPQPALVYAHGGGIVACTIDEVGRPGVAQLVAESGVQAFAVEYRLAPEFAYPTPVEDCYAALEWIVSRAQELRVDAARIAVIGQSGGGNLAAGVALLARDRQLSPPLAKQILIYPMIDDRGTSTLDPRTPRGQHLGPGAARADVCWDAYIGAEKRGRPDADVSPYASPSRADNLAGLPSTYIDVGSLDEFRDESMAYGARLMAADVDVELHVYAGLPHIFDLLAPGIPATLNAKENRLRVIRNL